MTPFYWPLMVNSIQFILYTPKLQITNLPWRDLQCLHIRHPCPRTSHWNRKNSQKPRGNHSTAKKKRKKPSGKQQRRIPLPGWTEAIYVMFPDESVTALQHIQWIWRKLWLMSSKHGPRCRFPQSMKQKAEERRGGGRHQQGPWGRRHKGRCMAIGKETRSSPGAGCRKQGQAVRSQDQLQTQLGPMDPMRWEGTKTPGKK